MDIDDEETSRLGRSRSRSDSAERHRALNGVNAKSTADDVLTIPLGNDDIPFILGKRGATKQKISRVSRSQLHLNEENRCIEIRGSFDSRRRAFRYVKLVIAQRTSRPPVEIGEEGLDEMTLVGVPSSCVARLTGRQGSFLRQFEEKWNVLLLFVQVKNKSTANRLVQNYDETLAIFGRRQPRTAVQLRILSLLTNLDDNYLNSKDLDGVLDDIVELKDEDGQEEHLGPWGVDSIAIQNLEDYRYASGSHGKTREKIAVASGSIIEFINETAFFVGYRSDRERGKTYLTWVIQQRTGISDVGNEENRNDCTIIDVDTKVVGFITGSKGVALQKIENDTGTFIFAKSGRKTTGSRQRFLIFSYDKKRRGLALEALKRRVDEKEELDMKRNDYYYTPKARESSYRHEESSNRRRHRDQRHTRSRSPLRRARRDYDGHGSRQYESDRRQDYRDRDSVRHSLNQDISVDDRGNRRDLSKQREDRRTHYSSSTRSSRRR